MRKLDGLSLKPAPEPLALVQAFVNTRNVMHGYDLLEEVDGATSWLSERGFLGCGVRPNEDDRRRLVAFREGLRTLLLSHNGEPGGESGVEALNELAPGGPLAARFGSGGEPLLVPAGGEGATGGIMGGVLAAVVLSAAEGKWRRLKACRNEVCLWAFYDGSKNRSGSWCTMDVCGARAKMRTYRRKKTG